MHYWLLKVTLPINWAIVFWPPDFPPFQLKSLLMMHFVFSSLIFYSPWFCWWYCISVYYNLDDTIFSLNWRISQIVNFTILSRTCQTFLYFLQFQLLFFILTFSYIFIKRSPNIHANALERSLKCIPLATCLSGHGWWLSEKPGTLPVMLPGSM